MKNSIHDLIIAPWKMYIAFAAVRLKIFTHLSQGSMAIETLSTKCGAVLRLLKPLLEACVSMGLLEKNNSEYKNSLFSQTYLVEGEPLYTGDLIELQQDEQKEWNKLYEIILTKDHKIANKQSNAEKQRTFIKAMNNLGMLGEAEALRNAVDLSGCRIMIDAGGGSGLYSLLLCQKYPELKAIILDKRETLNITKEFLSGHKEAERISLYETDIEKDFFGEKVDVVLLSDVVYDELTAEKVLHLTWNCLQPQGRLIIRGYYSDPENLKPLFGALFVFNQIVFDPSRNILTFSDLQEMVLAAGFFIESSRPLTERSYLLIARK